MRHQGRAIELHESPQQLRVYSPVLLRGVEGLSGDRTSNIDHHHPMTNLAGTNGENPPTFVLLGQRK